MQEPSHPGVVHFAIIEDANVRPLCGSWRDGPSWTTLPRAVTCPHCFELMRAGTPPDGRSDS